MVIYTLCACLAQPMMVQADTNSAEVQETIDAIEYESELIRRAEESVQDENGEYAVLYSKYEVGETEDGAETSAA